MHESPTVLPTLLGLAADLGGTNIRFGLVTAHGVNGPSVRQYKIADYASLAEVTQAYLSEQKLTKVTAAAFAVAAPVLADTVKLTNYNWTFSAPEIEAVTGGPVTLLNDWAAIGYSVRDLHPVDDLLALFPHRPAQPAGMRVMTGPGTGLGTCIVHEDAASGRLDVIPSEAAHMTFTPRTADQQFLGEFLQGRFKHVSWERLLSGPGLAMMYEAIGHEILAPNEVTRRALAGDSAGQRVIQLFMDSLAHYAGNLALTVCATGGVYLGGGIVPHIIELLDVARFDTAFTDKGRFEGFLAQVPVYVIRHPNPGLLGAARYLLSQH